MIYFLCYSDNQVYVGVWFVTLSAQIYPQLATSEAVIAHAHAMAASVMSQTRIRHHAA